MRVSSLRAIKIDYPKLVEFFDSYTSTNYTSTAQAKGFLIKLNSFDFLFFLNFALNILGPIEILNTELQSPKLSIMESY